MQSPETTRQLGDYPDIYSCFLSVTHSLFNTRTHMTQPPKQTLFPSHRCLERYVSLLPISSRYSS